MDPKDRVLFQPMIMIQFWSFFILFIVHTSKSMFEDSPDLIHLVLEDNNISDLGKPSILLKQTYILKLKFTMYFTEFKQYSKYFA